MRILVIDDDEPTTELLGQTLERDGHTVVTETTGTAGRERAVAEPFDLILCDIGLPDVNGFALARQMRAAGVDARLLALSGYTSDQDRSLGLASGFDNYLTKPIKASVLREEIRFQGSRPRSPRGTAAVPSPAVVETPAPAPAPAALVIAPTPPRRRGVLGGLVVIALGVPFVLQPLGVPNAASYLFISMGVAFLISYVRGRQYVYLIPMVTLISFGVALLLPTWISMRPESAAPAFVGVIAIGFVVAFGLAPQRRWPLVPAVLLGVVAAGRLVTGTSLIPDSLEPFLVPVVLIGVGAYLLAEPKT
ncbi:MAG TPA: response regulator [Candidatus Limnocylindria bacterium]|nr:response regulator [Candidatus Limnocylindria bacterium]